MAKNMKFFERINKLREINGWTIKEHAEKLDISPKMYAHYLKTEYMPAIVFKRAIKLHNLDVTKALEWL